MTPKHLIKILVLVAVLFGLWKIGPWQPTKEDNASGAEYSVYVNEIRETFTKQMFNEMGLVCTGHQGMMHGKLEEIGFNFNAYHRATVEEARALELLVIDRLVHFINGHEKLQPFLDEQPFTHKRVSISISFEGPYGRYADGSVGRISNISDLAGALENRNRIFYDSIDPFSGNLIELFNEPYEEAVKIAQALQNPIIHKNTPLEEAIDEVFFHFAQEMSSECGFECWSIGGKVTHSLEDIGVKFVTLQRATQEEARQLALFATERLLHAVNTNEKLRPYLIEYPFSANRLKMHIGFRRSNYYSYHDGSMESVTVEGNEITYFQQPPAGLDVYPVDTPVFAKESYQEASLLRSDNTVEKILFSK